MMYQKLLIVLFIAVCLLMLAEKWHNVDLGKKLSDERTRANELRVRLNYEREKLARKQFKAVEGAAPVVINETTPTWTEGWSGGSITEGKEEELYTSSHCIGVSEKWGKDPHTWKKSTCRFRNLCFNPETERFQYYKRPEDEFGVKSSVAIGPLNVQWGEEDKMLMKWLPEVIDGPLKKPYFTTSEEEVWIPHFEHCAANVMHLIMDSFYPWHGAVSLFGIEKHIKPLRVVLQNKTLWGTCDFIKEEQTKGAAWAQGYYSRCTGNQARWLPAMLPNENNQQVKELLTTREWMKEGVNGDKRLICFKDAVVGVGVLSDHCLKSHGWSWDKTDLADHDCNQARGEMLWTFRRRMLMVGGVPLTVPKSHKVLLFSFGHRGGPRWQVYQNALKERLGDGVVVEAAQLLTAKEQMAQIQSATAAVASMGGNTITAIFLPRNAGLLLLHDNKDRLDWDFWTHASHINLEWTPANAPNVTEAIGTTIQRMLVNYEEFSPFTK